eukprot:13116177-Alexandrium_andersonii.AAC.1
MTCRPRLRVFNSRRSLRQSRLRASRVRPGNSKTALQVGLRRVPWGRFEPPQNSPGPAIRASAAAPLSSKKFQ